MVRECKNCTSELPEWQAHNALYCQDRECIRQVAKINNDRNNAKMREKRERVRKKEALLKRTGAF